jgi:RNA polymerase sigma factor (sigma-70 family)
VRAVAFGVLADYHAAQDVAQDAFLRAFQNLDTLEDAAAFGGWVRSIARRRALSGLRRPVKVASLDAAGGLACDSAAQPDADLSRSLVEAVATLPENEQAVVMLYYFDEQGVRSISEILGRPVGTVTMQLSRARERLRGWLKEQEP